MPEGAHVAPTVPYVPFYDAKRPILYFETGRFVVQYGPFCNRLCARWLRRAAEAGLTGACRGGAWEAIQAKKTKKTNFFPRLVYNV